MVQEHSVMTSWPSERKAILNMISQFGSGVFACVMDSYDYVQALEKVLPSIKQEKVDKGGFMVLRPDSGDPVEAVLQVTTPRP
jgi:nicotinamide phosphoribosyltransferase